MTTHRPTLRLAPLLFLALITVLLALVPAAARGATTPESELAAAVTAGRLDPAVYDAVMDGGSAEGLVIFDDSSIQAQASALRASFGLRFDNEYISAFISSALSTRKADAHASAGRGASVLQDYSSFGIQYVGFDSAAALAAMLRSPLVSGVAANATYTPTLSQSLPLINQPAAAAVGQTGAGTAIAIIDTGVDYTNNAFGPCTAVAVPASCKVAYAQDFAPDDGQRDDNGHGTNVAGIASGVAPGAKILALDVFRSNGYAYDTDIVAALNWVNNNRATYNIASANMSLGDGSSWSSQCSSASNPYLSAITTLRTNGILTAIASGNDRYTNGISSPACTPGAISVGAVYDSNMGALNWSSCSDSTTAADKVTCWSNSASYLSLLAPGSQITAADNVAGSGTITYSGTSMAAPHVSGGIAVLRAAVPGASAAQLETWLTTTGPNVTDTRNGIVKHRLDICAAVNAAGITCVGTAPPPPPSGPTCYALTILISGTGTVSRSPSASSGCASGQYTAGAKISLNARPGWRQKFLRWSATAGTLSSTTSSTTTFTMPVPGQSATVTATFVKR